MSKISVSVSVIALALSLFAVCAVYLNPSKDVSSNMIATLGIICTVLIGWQILSLVNLNQYEKRIRQLQSEIELTKKNLDNVFKNAYMMQHLSDGLIYHALADIYRDISTLPDTPKAKLLSKEASWLLAEIEVCLYTNNIEELRRAKNDIAQIINSNDLNLEVLREIWDKCQNRYGKASCPKHQEILEEIEKVNQLFDNPG